MEGYECRHLDVKDWEIVALGDEYYRMIRVLGYTSSYAPLSNEDLDQLVDVYHYWKILLGHRFPRFEDMNDLLHCLHFDVIIELFCHRKLRQKLGLDLIF